MRLPSLFLLGFDCVDLLPLQIELPVHGSQLFPGKPGVDYSRSEDQGCDRDLGNAQTELNSTASGCMSFGHPGASPDSRALCTPKSILKN
jgi:hypothetical protein